ncbi:BamA/TamA family outer membrane protein [Algoriphagus zhangzhouensis]|uniref:Surface antigen n=1 Tax=Algoriphagus zhangzhouensis TaxID=1073327 RepID=A0A1M7ZH49_9BACT|nr:BamA/TamA family outer membrane protein [Algoriphagus zhangzhouensis]TDY44112.1 surface antigen-like protein [Algoriphagus zhangzhouensis]SHO64240.1 Surface antigen [Algoriphagus zhangzhouensis]
MRPILLSFVLLLTFTQFSFSQESDSLPKQKKVEVSVMPYMSYNRNLDFMIGVIPMGMYRINPSDTISPKSLSGLAAVYTTNGSYFISVFNKIYLDEDKWRLTAFAMTGDRNSQFYMDDMEDPGFYDFGTETTYAMVGFQRQVFTDFYAGLNYSYAHHYTEYEDDIQEPSTVKTNGLQITGLYDNRNSVYYPTKGVKTNLKLISFPTWFGNDVKAQKISAEFNEYFPMRNGHDVLAARFAGKFGLGDIAFEQQVTLGGKDIRGYSQGKFRGDGLMALQGEYRYNFKEGMGLVGFFGLGTIYGSDTEDFNWKLYPGGGVGYRYGAFKSVRFNIGLDAAVGKDDWGIYFRIGESF